MKHFFMIFGKIWTLMKPFQVWFVVLLVLSVLQKGAGTLNAYLQGRLITSASDVVAHGQGEYINVVYFGAALLLAFFAQDFVGYIWFRLWSSKLNNPAQLYLQEHSLRRILRLTVMQQKEEHSALKIDSVGRGEDAVFSLSDQFMRVLVPTIVQLGIGFSVLFGIDWRFGAGAAVVFAILLVWVMIYQKSIYSTTKQHRDNMRELNKIKQEAYTHLESVKVLARENYFIKNYIEARKGKVEFGMRMSLRNITNEFRRDTLMSVSKFIALAFALTLYVNGSLAIGTVYFVYATMQSVLNQVDWLNMAIRNLPQDFANAEKYFEVIDVDPAFTESGNKIDKYNSDITIEHLGFKYPNGEHKTIDNISLVIPAGKTTAFVGHSGSGKTTIARLLLRAYPYEEGSIKIGGEELASIDAQDLREHVGYVEQHVDLFDDTVRENILIGVAPEKREEVNARIDEIGKRARISEFAHRLGDAGYDTIVGERGVKLSGGERQRVGIARALAKDPDIYIFDEATASLDAINEKAVMDAFYDAAAGKTTVVIAHRLSTVRNADKIIVMDRGRVVASGSHDELMKTSPEYQDLVRHQIEQ